MTTMILRGAEFLAEFRFNVSELELKHPVRSAIAAVVVSARLALLILGLMNRVFILLAADIAFSKSPYRNPGFWRTL
jgi:hypothetical protein